MTNPRATISRLLALAARAGTPAEAEAAEGEAARLMARHGIARQDAIAWAEQVGESFAVDGRHWHLWVMQAAYLIGKARGCRVLWHDSKATFVGRRADASAARDLFVATLTRINLAGAAACPARLFEIDGGRESWLLAFREAAIDALAAAHAPKRAAQVAPDFARRDLLAERTRATAQDATGRFRRSMRRWDANAAGRILGEARASGARVGAQIQLAERRLLMRCVTCDEQAAQLASAQEAARVAMAAARGASYEIEGLRAENIRLAAELRRTASRQEEDQARFRGFVETPRPQAPPAPLVDHGGLLEID